MRIVAATVAAAVLALGLVPVAGAAPASGSTSLLGVPHQNQPMDVRVAILSDAPVAPYEFALRNECWFSGRYAGHVDSVERFDLIGPWFAGPDGAALTTVTINLQPVPAGAACRVSIVNGNATVKDSTTAYAVVP
jgi:hypothetical protein